MTNIFGGAGAKGDIVNLAIGIIVSIIGVRFMPEGAWTSLTTPASAFVATILVAIPFAALFFITMKLESNLGRKLMWLFYIIFLSYLIFSSEGISKGIRIIYVIFLVLAGLMMGFDGTVRMYIAKERENIKLKGTLSDVQLVERIKIKEKIKELTKMITVADSTEVPLLQKQIDDYNKKLRLQLKP